MSLMRLRGVVHVLNQKRRGCVPVPNWDGDKRHRSNGAVRIKSLGLGETQAHLNHRGGVTQI